MEPNHASLAQNQSQAKKKEKKVNFCWSKPMSKDLLEFLADEVRKGNRPNNTFRISSFTAAAQMISEKYNTNCSADHVENHMKTQRSAWQIISTVQGRSGFGWNDNLKMVTASPNALAAYVKQYPAHEKFLNRPIENYEDMSIVVGKDMARGNFAKTFSDIQTLDDEAAKSEGAKSESANSSETRSHRKSMYNGDLQRALQIALGGERK